MEDIRSVLRPISVRHFERSGFIHKVGDFYPMLQRQAKGWIQQFQRRILPRCSVKHPWQVIVEEKLARELFDMVEVIVLKTNYGVITVKTKKNCVCFYKLQSSQKSVFNFDRRKSAARHFSEKEIERREAS